MLVISIASSAEINNIKKKTIIKQQKLYSGALFIKGILNGKEILMVKTGVGAKKAKAAARGIIKNYSHSCVLSLGAAGAVDPSLDIGDVVVIKKNVQRSGQNFLCDDDLSQKAFNLLRRSGLPVTWGDCLTLDRFVHLKEEKKSINDMPGVRVVDMESAAVARVICSANAPFFNVRVISDTAGDDTVDMFSIVKRRKVAGRLGVYTHFLGKPSDLLRAVKFKKDMIRVRRVILHVVEVLVEGLSESLI